MSQQNILIALIGLIIGVSALRYYRNRGLSLVATVLLALVIGLALGFVLIGQ